MIDVLMPVMFTEPDWQVPMTKYAIECLTIDPGADFNLVVVETGSNYLAQDPLALHHKHAHQYIHCPNKTAYTSDANEGLEACEAEFVIHTGNDVFVRPGWASALLEPFEKYKDCGVSCLASGDLPAPISTIGDHIIEGVYGPFMMFRRQWNPVIEYYPATNCRDMMPYSDAPKQFDPAFPDIFSDTDLILAHYGAGLRSYRNHKVRIEHLNRATYDTLHSEAEQLERFHKYKNQMATKHFKACGHLRMFHHLIDGHVV